MKKLVLIITALLALALFAGAASASVSIGGERGVIQVKCDVEGATATLVSLSGEESTPQTIIDGQTEFAVYSTGTPYTSVRMEANGYVTASYHIASMPAAGSTIVIDTHLVEVPGPIGGDRGVIRVTSNVEGATVQLISVNGEVIETGTIESGQVEFPVYVMGTPVSQVRVSAAGYETGTQPVNMPGSGATSTVNVPLYPVPTPTSSPMGALIGLFGLAGAALLLRRA